jgi:N-acetylneuraminate synthase
LNSKVFRRSIYFISDLRAGDRIAAHDIKRMRPGFGVAPKYFDEIVGRVVLRDVDRGEAVHWDILKP